MNINAGLVVRGPGSEGPVGPGVRAAGLEVGAQRAPRLLVCTYLYPSVYDPTWRGCSGDCQRLYLYFDLQLFKTGPGVKLQQGGFSGCQSLRSLDCFFTLGKLSTVMGTMGGRLSF